MPDDLTGGSSMELLKQVISDTDERVQQYTAQETQVNVFLQSLAQAQQEFDEASKIADERIRVAKMRIATDKLADIRKRAQQEEKDIATIVLGLKVLMKDIGVGFETLERLNPDEEAIITRAQDRVKTALTRVEQTKALLGPAQYKVQDLQSRTFVWRRKSKIRAANEEVAGINQAIARAAEEVKKATAGIQEAKVEAETKWRQRLQNANMEQSFAEMTTMVTKTIGVMRKRFNDLQAELKAVRERLKKAYEIKQQAADALETLDQQMNNLEDELSKEEAALKAMVRDPSTESAYNVQEQKVSELRQKYEEVSGKRNAAFALLEVKEKFVLEEEQHISTHNSLIASHRMWIAMLQASLEERQITYESRLQAMKAIADQEMATAVTNVGNEVDDQNVEAMAAMATSSARTIATVLQGLKIHDRRILMARQAAAQSMQQVAERFETEITEFRTRYGMDVVTMTSVLSPHDESETEVKKDDGGPIQPSGDFNSSSMLQ